MIGFQDFVPEYKKDKGGFFGLGPKSEQLSETLQRINNWITAENVDVVSIETVVIPPGKNDSTDDLAHTVEFFGSVRIQFLRVWYRHS